MTDQTTSEDALLSLDGVEMSYGPFTVLHGLTLRVHAGETVALIGANGAGKSTVVKAVAGFVRPRAGSIRFAGEEIAGRRPHEVLRRGCAYVAQGQDLFPEMSVRENVAMGGYTVRDRTLLRERLARCESMFPVLRDKAEVPAQGLSGGERQQLKIARALMTEPRLLLLDEPTAGLSPAMVEQVFDDLARVREATGIAVLLIEQNIVEGLENADRGCVLELGVVTVDRPAAELLEASVVDSLWLGTTPETPT